MFIRALLSFLILPGMVAGVIPGLIATMEPHRNNPSAFGPPVLALGLFLLLFCVRDFFVSGKGTLAPWDPPKHLVTVGLYRAVRNPMYVAVLTTIVGWSLATGSLWLTWYAFAMALIFHVRVVSFEEPTLKKLFGEEWRSYSARIPRWFPKLR